MVTMIPFALDITKTLSLLPSSHLVPGKRKLGFSIDDIVGEDKNTVQEGKICQSNGRLNSSSQLPSSHRSTNDDVNRFTPPPIAHHHQPSHRSCPQAPSSAPPRVGIARSSPSPPISRSPNGSRSASSSSCASNTTSKHHSPASQIKSESRSVSPTATHLLHSNKNIASISSPSSNVPQTIDSPSFNLHHHHPSQPPLPPPHPPISHQAHPHPFHPHPTQAPPQPSPHHQATLHPALSPHQHIHSHPHPNHLEANKVLQHPASLACNPQEAFAAAFSSNYFALSSRLPIEYRSPYHQWFLARHSPLALQTPYPGSPITPFMFFNRKPKRVRTAFSPTQLMELETAFDKNNYVIGNERKELAKKLGLNETQVKVWFQNRRTKQKRQKQEEDDGTYQVSNSDNRGEADDSECMSDIEDEEDTEMYNGTGNTYHHQQDSSPKAVNSSPNSHR